MAMAMRTAEARGRSTLKLANAPSRMSELTERTRVRLSRDARPEMSVTAVTPAIKLTIIAPAK